MRQERQFKEEILGKMNGILLPKLFCPTVRKIVLKFDFKLQPKTANNYIFSFLSWNSFS